MKMWNKNHFSKFLINATKQYLPLATFGFVTFSLLKLQLDNNEPNHYLFQYFLHTPLSKEWTGIVQKQPREQMLSQTALQHIDFRIKQPQCNWGFLSSNKYWPQHIDRQAQNVLYSWNVNKSCVKMN